MELEKTMTVAAPAARVWATLLDPVAMSACVPGTQSVEVLGPDEYLAEVKVKFSFISVQFRMRTTIVDSRPPEYLRVTGTGEDSRIASSVAHETELFVTDLGDGQTEIRVAGRAQIFGKLGSFGLSMMKPKIDRIWSEFGAALADRLATPEAAPEAATA
jgi:carbon monoxide dehydrogenase subunit G